MIALEQYGVKLTRLQQKDIELIRYWRNQHDVSMYMEYRNYINPKAQQEWFKSINNPYNYYFIIEFEGKKIGLINSRNYDQESGFSEGGIFIWNKEYIDSFAPVYSTLCLLNFVFFVLKVDKVSTIRILKTNTRAINYNKMIGYQLMPDQENVVNQVYKLNIDDYRIHGEKLNKAAVLLNPNHHVLQYYGTDSPENLEEVNQLLRIKNT